MRMEDGMHRRWITAGLLVLLGLTVFALWTKQTTAPAPPAARTDSNLEPSATMIEPQPVHGVSPPIAGNSTTVPAGLRPDAVDDTADKPVLPVESGTVTGHVLLDDAPLAGVTIVLSATEPLEVVSEQPSNERGVFQFEDVPSGIFDLQGEYVAGQRQRPLRVHQQIVVEPGKTTRTTLVFPGAPSTLEGFVTFRGKTVPEAHITGSLVDDASETYFGASTDNAGFYRVENVMPGSIWLDVVVEIVDSGTRKKSIVVEIPPGSVVRQDVAFGGTAVVHGVVDGIGPGEVGEVMLVPAVYAVEVRDLSSLHALRESAVAITSINRDGAYRFGSIEGGRYTAIAVALVREPAPGAAFDECVRTSVSALEALEGEEVREDLQL